MEQDSAEAGPSTASRSNRILLLSLQGLPESSLTQLAHSITDGESKKSADGEVLHDNAEGSSSFITTRNEDSTVAWTIDNRYYTADVRFKVASIDLPSNALAIRRPSEKTKRELQRLREEMEGIQAVVAVVQSSPDMSLKDHERFLDHLDQSTGEQEEESMPVGFGLAVSVVVALPKAIDPSKAALMGNAPKKEELIELYADHGWEYVDVAASAGLGLGNEGDDEGMSDDDAASDAGSTEEAQGLARVKEALEANLWPNLVRKDSTRAEKETRRNTTQDKMPTSPVQDRHMSTQQIIDANDDEEDDEIEAMFRKLGLNLPSMSVAGGATIDSHAEPTAQDEELARRFLASISDFEKHHAQVSGPDDDTPFDLNALLAQSEPQGSHTLPESEEDRKAHQEDALRKLEEFLKVEDDDWPAVSEGGEAGTDVEKTGSTKVSNSFDDDFDDFVKAPVAQSTKRDEGDDGAEWLSTTHKESQEGESGGGDKEQP